MINRLFDRPRSTAFRFDGDPTGERRNADAAHGDATKRPSVETLVPRLLGALAGRGWVSAAVLAVELRTDARALREAAHRSDGLVLGHLPGYILTTEATLEEVHAVTRRLLSQSNRMRDRVRQIERVRHAHSVGGAA